MPVREDIHSPLPEEIVDVGDVSPQEIQCVRMIVLHRLGHIDNMHLVLIVEHVVLTEICMDELAFLIQNSHDLHDLEIDLTPSLHALNFGIL